jgi:hypothetical protein
MAIPKPVTQVAIDTSPAFIKVVRKRRKQLMLSLYPSMSYRRSLLIRSLKPPFLGMFFQAKAVHCLGFFEVSFPMLHPAVT